jgi:hypothetical protein
MAADYSGLSHIKTDGLPEKLCTDCSGHRVYTSCFEDNDIEFFCQYCEGVGTVYDDFPPEAQPQPRGYPRTGGDPTAA